MDGLLGTRCFQDECDGHFVEKRLRDIPFKKRGKEFFVHLPDTIEACDKCGDFFMGRDLSRKIHEDIQKQEAWTAFMPQDRSTKDGSER